MRRWDGRALRATLAGIGDRDAAERLRGCEVLLARSELPATRPHEYYCEDLLGFTVRNGTGAVLGNVAPLRGGAGRSADGGARRA